MKKEIALKKLRTRIIELLWKEYLNRILFLPQFLRNLQPTLDHFAIIDIKSDNSGISHLQSIFQLLGFEFAGSGYIPEKINDFIWMREPNFAEQQPKNSLPQVVLADFRNDLLPTKLQNIIKKYTSNIPPFDSAKLAEKINNIQNTNDLENLANTIFQHLTSRSWDLPNTQDYHLLKQENELMAWSLLMGRTINHFGLQIHLCNEFDSLGNFMEYFQNHPYAKVNKIAGIIKGTATDGIEQASSIGAETEVKTLDGNVMINDSFVEFIWRHPNKQNPRINLDYFSGFIAKSATNVVESLYNSHSVNC